MIKDILAMDAKGQKIEVKAWVRTFRNNQFISIYDGSTLSHLQAVLEFDKVDDDIIKKITTGASLSIVGDLVPSKGSGAKI